MNIIVLNRRQLAFGISLFVSIAGTTAAVGAVELTPGESAFQQALGRECPVVALWPTGAIPDEEESLGAEHVGLDRGRPGTMMIRNVSQPSLTIARPTTEPSTGAAILLCPGGGYGGLAIEPVVEAAQWFNALGVTVAFLKYRVPKRNQGLTMFHHGLQDAQRAVGILRSRAADWKIHPHKIGVGGFSAGGHLAATIANLHESRSYSKIDAADEESCRPDFSLLLNPAYLTDPILSRKLAPHLQVARLSAKRTPPTFTAITTPDTFTGGAVEYSLALRQAKVNLELHILPSLADSGEASRKPVDANRVGANAEKKYPIESWATECQRWLGDLGIVRSPPKPEPLTYLAADLPDIVPADPLTLGDARLRQILGRNAPVIPLWPPGLAPDEAEESGGPETVTHRSRGGQALNITNVTRPTLTLIKPPATGRPNRAVIVCPGGAYSGLAAEHEGTRVAQWLNELGITALLLKYRVPRRGGDFLKHHHALQDLQRSMRIVRSRAQEWDIDPDQIGVCGFSAGGHLCTALATNFQTDSYPPLDAIDSHSARPAFALLVYPAYLTDPIDSDKIDVVARGTLQAGLTPRMFMTVAANDRFARGMFNYYLEVRKAGVDAECHVYAAGGHGGGLDPVSYPSSQWKHAAAQWLNSR